MRTELKDTPVGEPQEVEIFFRALNAAKVMVMAVEPQNPWTIETRKETIQLGCNECMFGRVITASAMQGQTPMPVDVQCKLDGNCKKSCFPTVRADGKVICWKPVK